MAIRDDVPLCSAYLWMSFHELQIIMKKKETWTTKEKQRGCLCFPLRRSTLKGLRWKRGLRDLEAKNEWNESFKGSTMFQSSKNGLPLVWNRGLYFINLRRLSLALGVDLDVRATRLGIGRTRVADRAQEVEPKRTGVAIRERPTEHGRTWVAIREWPIGHGRMGPEGREWPNGQERMGTRGWAREEESVLDIIVWSSRLGGPKRANNTYD